MSLQTILIAGGAVLFVLILGIRLRKYISLTVTRMMYGQFSIEFFQLYKRYFVRSPFQYCFRDEFVTHLLFVLEKNGTLPAFKSEKEIYFESTPYFINYKEFLKKKGTPYCFNAFAFHNPDFIIKALGYHETVAGSKAILVFYFMDDIFFMGEYIFKNPKTNIKESLVGHFMGNRKIDADNFYIENTRERIIHYQDTGFTVDIKYITEEEVNITNNLRTYLSQVKGKKLVMEP